MQNNEKRIELFMFTPAVTFEYFMNIQNQDDIDARFNILTAVTFRDTKSQFRHTAK